MSPSRFAAGRGIGAFIFFSRWLQAPLYVGLIVAQLIYVVVFIIELVHLAETVLSDPGHINEAQIMLAVLGLIDVVMIANLLIMVIIGGYETFVSRIKLNDHPDQPEWLSHVNANVLKVKLAMAIIGISSIHLLKTFIEVGNLGAPSAGAESITGATYTEQGVLWQVIIHCVFILSAVALAWIDRISRPAHPHPPLTPVPQHPTIAVTQHPIPVLPTATQLALPPANPHPAPVVTGQIINGYFIPHPTEPTHTTASTTLAQSTPPEAR